MNLAWHIVDSMRFLPNNKVLIAMLNCVKIFSDKFKPKITYHQSSSFALQHV